MYIPQYAILCLKVRQRIALTLKEPPIEFSGQLSHVPTYFENQSDSCYFITLLFGK